MSKNPDPFLEEMKRNIKCAGDSSITYSQTMGSTVKIELDTQIEELKEEIKEVKEIIKTLMNAIELQNSKALILGCPDTAFRERNIIASKWATIRSKLK